MDLLNLHVVYRIDLAFVGRVDVVERYSIEKSKQNITQNVAYMVLFYFYTINGLDEFEGGGIAKKFDESMWELIDRENEMLLFSSLTSSEWLLNKWIRCRRKLWGKWLRRKHIGLLLNREFRWHIRWCEWTLRKSWKGCATE